VIPLLLAGCHCASTCALQLLVPIGGSVGCILDYIEGVLAGKAVLSKCQIFLALVTPYTFAFVETIAAHMSSNSKSVALLHTR